MRIIFLKKILLTDKQVSKLCKAFDNNSSANLKLSKTQLSKLFRSGLCLGRILRSLLEAGLASVKNVLKKLAKNFLIQ